MKTNGLKSSYSILLIISFLFLSFHGNVPLKTQETGNEQDNIDYNARNYTFSEGFDAFTNYIDNREEVHQSIQRSLNSPVKFTLRNITTEKDISPAVKNEILHYLNLEISLLISLHKVKLIFPFNYFW